MCSHRTAKSRDAQAPHLAAIFEIRIAEIRNKLDLSKRRNDRNENSEIGKRTGFSIRLTWDLARIYACVGEKDLALQLLAMSAGQTLGVSYGELQLEPEWDPLRGDPRFEKIVASLASKETSPERK
jgi:hypothetical protein